VPFPVYDVWDGGEKTWIVFPQSGAIGSPLVAVLRTGVSWLRREELLASGLGTCKQSQAPVWVARLWGASQACEVSRGLRHLSG
jgi:hypothetical protein